eukprot:XP_015572815.1 uncharacterized protein LOC8273831 isoform X1 [Ricinus communis]
MQLQNSLFRQKVDRDMEDDERVKTANKWLENISKGITSHQLEALSLDGLKIVHSHEGFILCNFVVSNRITDGDGNWKVGAMATLIDDVGAAAIYSLIGHIKVSLDFNISYYSTAKTQAIEAPSCFCIISKDVLLAIIHQDLRNYLCNLLIVYLLFSYSESDYVEQLIDDPSRTWRKEDLNRLFAREESEVKQWKNS